MHYIWSFESLRGLLGHKEPMVREWAVGRLSALYPERAGDAVIELITDKDEAVVMESIAHFITHPDRKYADQLLDAYRTSSEMKAGRLADAIIAIEDAPLVQAFNRKYEPNGGEDPWGYALSVFHVARLRNQESRDIAKSALQFLEKQDEESICETIFASNLTAETSLTVLFDFCFKRPQNPSLLIGLLVAIGNECGAWYSKEDLMEETKNKGFQRHLPEMVTEALAYLGEKGLDGIAKGLEKKFKKRKHKEIIGDIYHEMRRLLEEREKACEEEPYLLWLKGRGRPQQIISAIEAIYKNIPQEGEWAAEWMARSVLSLFSLLPDYGPLIGMDIEGLDMEKLLHVYFQDRDDVEEDSRIKEILADHANRDMMVQSCLEHVEKGIDSLANGRIVGFLADMMDEDIAGRLLRIETGNDDLWDRIFYAVTKLGPTAVPLLAGLFKQDDHMKIGYALQVLKGLPLEASVELILDNWEMLWKEYKETLLWTVRDIGDRRFITPLKAELKEGEFHEAEVFFLLCLIHQVTDPELKRIKNEMKSHDMKRRQRMDKLIQGDVEGLFHEHLQIELRCLGCRKTYHYQIEDVMISSAYGEPFIVDDVRCKNCGVLDHYEITSEGNVSIMTHTMLMIGLGKKEKRSLDDSPIKIVETGPIDGKSMSMKEAVRYYEKKVGKDPKNLNYILGYANTLRRSKRTEDAIPVYEKAIQEDPLAVEAYASLAQIAEKKGNLAHANDYYERAAAMINRGHYYKVTMDLDDFKEAVLDNFLDVSRRLGRKAGMPHDVYPEPPAPKKKIGRNAPCPCGSGKKYKKCCLLKEQQKLPEKPPADAFDKRLMDRIFKYSETIPKKEFLNAVALYWRTEPKEPVILPEEAQDDGGAFMAWYIHDYSLSTGKTILEQFYESHANRLKDDEKAFLQSDMKTCPGLYEVIEVREGEDLTLSDIFHDDILSVKEVKGSYQVVKWDILMVRIIDIKGTRRFAGNAQIIPRQIVQELKAFMLKEFDAFKREVMQDDWQAFMKGRSYLINHYMRDASREEPVFFTPEGHSVIFGKARFDALAFEKILDILDLESDFVVDEVIPSEKAKLSWLKRGKSKEWDVVEHGEGTVLDSKLMHESGKMSWDIMGSITISGKRLFLETHSRERLERGKNRLDELLKDHIRHVADSFESVKAATNRAGGREAMVKAEAIPENDRFTVSFLTEKYREWLDDRIPALDGMTPREAVRTAKRRERVLEFIKDMENREEKRKKEGGSYVDLRFLREDLGLE